MVSRRRTAGWIAGVTVVTGMLVAGCASGPSQVDSAAIIGNTAIPLSQVQGRLDSIFHKESGVKQQLQSQHRVDDLARQVVSLEVQHMLLGQVAKREKLSVDDKEVDRLIQQAGGAEAASRGTVYDASNFRERARDQLLLTALGRKYLGKLSVTVDYTQTTSRADALQRATRMAQGPRQAREVVASDSAAGVPAKAGFHLRASTSPQDAASPLFGVAPGTVVAFQASQQDQGGQWLVALVRQRNTNGSPDDQASRQAVSQASSDVLASVGQRMLAPYADRIGVRVNPRYGVWDQVGITAVPDPSQTLGVEIPVQSNPQ